MSLVVIKTTGGRAMSDTELLRDFVALEDLATQVKRHPRTVRRWTEEVNGLPYTWLGNQIYFHIPTATQWLVDRQRRPNPSKSK
jgi:hypothetical protein